MWEQHERSNETEVAADALEQLAEDVTYKIWELVNNIKVYATKSSGKVTVDLVNEVLKDANVDPILGVSFSFWDRIESDGTYFFNYDEEVDLQEEYTKDVTVDQLGALNLSAGWFGEPNRQQDLIEFYGNIVDGMYFGDEDLVHTILDIVGSNPHVALVAKLLLNKCIEMLAFEYSEEILSQTLQLLNAIVQNPGTQTGQFSNEISYLSQIFEALLLGATKELKYEEETGHFPVKMELHHLEEDEGLVNAFPTIQQELIGNLKSEADYPHFNEIKKECEDLFIMMDTSELNSSVKKEDQIDSNVLHLDDFYGNQHQQEVADDVSVKISDVSSEPDEPPKDVKAKLVTLKIPLQFLDDLCRTTGLCAGHWGNFEQELTYYLVKRLEEFFKQVTQWSTEEFEFIFRIAQGLWALGEFCFRELTPFLEKIDPQTAPDYLINVFNRAGIFIRGRNDIFLYEWLADLCGDTLTPFLLFYSASVQKFNLKIKRRLEKFQSTDISFKILPKILVTQIPKTSKPRTETCQTEFEGYKLIHRADKKKINFRFSGCRPVNLRGRKNKLIPTVVEPVIVQQPLDSFHSKVVIGKRKLLKPVSNIPKVSYCANYHQIVI